MVNLNLSRIYRTDIKKPRYLSWLYKMNIDRLRYKLKAKTVRDLKIGFLDSDHETLEWLNGLFSRLWSNFEAEVSEQIKDQISVVLDGLKISGFDEFRLSKFTLGSQVLSLSAISLLKILL